MVNNFLNINKAEVNRLNGEGREESADKAVDHPEENGMDEKERSVKKYYGKTGENDGGNVKKREENAVQNEDAGKGMKENKDQNEKDSIEEYGSGMVNIGKGKMKILEIRLVFLI